MKLKPVLYAMGMTILTLSMGLGAAGIKPGNRCVGIEPSWDYTQLYVLFKYIDALIAITLGMWLVYWLIMRITYGGE